jgi:hypothetical protein
MKKIITTLAVAGLGAAFMAGAQAQTFGPTNTTGAGGIYTLAVLENTSANTGTVLAPVYEYQYLVTLTGDTSGTQVNQFNINNIQGFLGGVTVKNGSTSSLTGPDFAEVGSPTVSGPAGATFTSLSFQSVTTGLVAVGAAPSSYDFTSLFGPDTTGLGDSAVFTFDSSLPPGGTVSLGSNGFGGTSTGGILSGTGGSKGPGPLTATVPETSSFALLGLGLLPLALIARRRLARNN